MGFLVISVVVGALGTVSQRLGKRTGTIRNQKKNWDPPDDKIVNIGQNTEKISGDRRLAVTPIPVKEIPADAIAKILQEMK